MSSVVETSLKRLLHSLRSVIIDEVAEANVKEMTRYIVLKFNPVLSLKQIICKRRNYWRRRNIYGGRLVSGKRSMLSGKQPQLLMLRKIWNGSVWLPSNWYRKSTALWTRTCWIHSLCHDARLLCETRASWHGNAKIRENVATTQDFCSKVLRRDNVKKQQWK